MDRKYFRSLLEQMMNENIGEEMYQNYVSQNPVDTILCFLQFIAENPNSKLSNFSTILLSRLISLLLDRIFSFDAEFQKLFIQTSLEFLNNEQFENYQLSLLSDLISRICLIYSKTDSNIVPSFLFTSIINNLQHNKFVNAIAGIDTIILCELNESINSESFSQETSQLIQIIFSQNPINFDLTLSALRLLYSSYPNISLDYQSFLPALFTHIKDDLELLTKFVSDIDHFLKPESYSLFSQMDEFFIRYFCSILELDNSPDKLSFCSLSILYNFSEIYYKIMLDNSTLILNALFQYLIHAEADSSDGLYYISRMAEIFGGVHTYSVGCYNLFENYIKAEDGVDPLITSKRQIAAMKLFSYSFKGNFIHLSIGIPDDYFLAIVQSGVMNSPEKTVRKVAFDMLYRLFQHFVKQWYYQDNFRFILYEPMIQNLAIPDSPDIYLVKLKVFSLYLCLFTPDDLYPLSESLETFISTLIERATQDDLIYLLKCIQALFSKCLNYPFDRLKPLIVYILQNPSDFTYGVYLVALNTITLIEDTPIELYNCCFTYIFEHIDFSVLSVSELQSVQMTFKQLSSNSPDVILSLFPLFASFTIQGASIEISASNVPLIEIAARSNQSISIERQMNVVHCYDGSQIQLVCLHLKILRYIIQNIAENPVPVDLFRPLAEQYYAIIMNWSVVRFSDRLQYNALKILPFFLKLIDYSCDFGPLFDQLFKFTIETVNESRLTSLYVIITKLYTELDSHIPLNQSIFDTTLSFYYQEYEKLKQRRKKIQNQIQSEDCRYYVEVSRPIEARLGRIWIPFWSSKSSFDFSQLIQFSFENRSVASICILGFYFMKVDHYLPIYNFFVELFCSDFDESTSLDSSEAGLCLFRLILERSLTKEEIDNLLGTYLLKPRPHNDFIFAPIILLLIDRYQDFYQPSALFSRLAKIGPIQALHNTLCPFVTKCFARIIVIAQRTQIEPAAVDRLLEIIERLKCEIGYEEYSIQTQILLEKKK